MPDQDQSFTVVAGIDRLSRREQVEQVLARARERREPLRVRLPMTLYDHADSRSYVFLRNATWNVQLPSETASPEMVEDLITAIGTCLSAIGQHGSQAVAETLRGMGQASLAEGTTGG